jgi:hypothetical protein
MKHIFPTLCLVGAVLALQYAVQQQPVLFDMITTAQADNRLLSGQAGITPREHIETPPDSTGIYAVGFGTGQTADLAIQNAQWSARSELIGNIKQVLGRFACKGSATTRKKLNPPCTALDDAPVEAELITGAAFIQRESLGSEGHFEAIVQIKMPFAQFHDNLAALYLSKNDPAAQAMYVEMARRLGIFQRELLEREQAKTPARIAPKDRTERMKPTFDL